MNDRPATGNGLTGDDNGAGLSGLAHSESTDEITDRYDQWASNYNVDLAAWGYSVPESVANELHQRYDSISADSGSILDAGCGTGLVGQALYARDLGPVDGVDASAESLRQANDLGVYRKLTTIDLSAALSISDASYYAVVCAGVLTYLSDTEAVLRELLRITKPQGWVIATQRTDLWIERECDAVITSLTDSGICKSEVSDPMPYLPGHDEYADQILAKTIVLHRC